jgi:uncharacterized protein (DUF362 family)
MGIHEDGINRRDFVRGSVAGLVGWPLLGSLLGTARADSPRAARIALCKTTDRRAGVEQVMKLLDFEPPRGRRVLVKPNFNTADPAPGSTHNDTLLAIVRELRSRGAGALAVGDRCGPAKMPEVLVQKGIPEMAKEEQFEVIDFGALPESDWLPFQAPGLHWENGFTVPRPVREADYIVLTPCLKTHQYGGVFTMSLKLAVGITPRGLMRQLHNNTEHMRRMIAEINLAYTPKLVVLDGVECFVDGGPMVGKPATAGVILAGTDRVAVDAAGLAVLREVGANDAVMGTPVFRQEQIARAVELGLGVGEPAAIEFVTADRESRLYADKLKGILTSA